MYKIWGLLKNIEIQDNWTYESLILNKSLCIGGWKLYSFVSFFCFLLFQRPQTCTFNWPHSSTIFSRWYTYLTKLSLLTHHSKCDVDILLSHYFFFFTACGFLTISTKTSPLKFVSLSNRHILNVIVTL